MGALVRFGSTKNFLNHSYFALMGRLPCRGTLISPKEILTLFVSYHYHAPKKETEWPAKGRQRTDWE